MDLSPDVSRFLAALDSHDAESIRDALSPEFEYEEVAGPGEPSIRMFVDELRIVCDALPDVTFRPVRQTRDGERLHVEFRAFGTHRAEFLHVQATGATAIFGGVFNIVLEFGRVRRLRMTVDFGGLRRQLLLAARIS